MKQSGPKDDLSALRDALAQSEQIEDITEQMLEVAAIVEEALAPLGIHPIVVGGLAVAFWAPGAYVTGDIDVVMPHATEVEETLASLGFQKKGRLWVLPDRELFFEAPGSYLSPNPEGWEEVELASGRRVRVQAAEEILLDRLREFVGTGHTDPLHQSLWLFGSSRLDKAKLERRGAEDHLEMAIKAVAELAEKVEAGESLPPTWELKELAKRLS